MSETLPPTPEAERPEGPNPPSRIAWFLCGITVAVMAYISVGHIIRLLSPSGIPHSGSHNVGSIERLHTAILSYAKDNDNHLPPTLWALIPKYIPESDFTALRFINRVTGEPSDWLYFLHTKEAGLRPDTILLATPGDIGGSSQSPQRLVCKANGFPDYLPEADFQRLIREQNPPASSPPPARQKTVQ